MDTIYDLENIREFFKKDRFATENGAVIDEVGDGYSRCSLLLTDRHQNAAGAVMGGVPFMLADFAFAVACNSLKPSTVSLASNITFYGVCRGSRLIAEAHCVKEGRTTCYYTIDVTDDLGNKVAAVTTNGFKKA